MPKNISRYFSPVSLERARAVLSLLIINDRNCIDQTSSISNSFAETLSRKLVKVAKAYEEKEGNCAASAHG
ncbi:MAG: hypothetical protein WA667_22180 [Candidatus Nitrosopolaris sp.]